MYFGRQGPEVQILSPRPTLIRRIHGKAYGDAPVSFQRSHSDGYQAVLAGPNGPADWCYMSIASASSTLPPAPSSGHALALAIASAMPSASIRL